MQYYMSDHEMVMPFNLEKHDRELRESLLNEILEYTYGMLTEEKEGLQQKIMSMMKGGKDEVVQKGL